MSNGLAIGGFILALISSLASLVVVVYKLGQVKGQFDAFAKTVIDAVAEMKEMRKEGQRDSAQIAVHERRITQNESITESQGRKLEDVWKKTFSHDKHLAVTRQALRSSQPDIGGLDDD